MAGSGMADYSQHYLYELGKKWQTLSDKARFYLRGVGHGLGQRYYFQRTVTHINSSTA